MSICLNSIEMAANDVKMSSKHVRYLPFFSHHPGEKQRKAKQSKAKELNCNLLMDNNLVFEPTGNKVIGLTCSWPSAWNWDRSAH